MRGASSARVALGVVVWLLGLEHASALLLVPSPCGRAVRGGQQGAARASRRALATRTAEPAREGGEGEGGEEQVDDDLAELLKRVQGQLRETDAELQLRRSERASDASSTRQPRKASTESPAPAAEPVASRWLDTAARHALPSPLAIACPPLHSPPSPPLQQHPPPPPITSHTPLSPPLPLPPIARSTHPARWRRPLTLSPLHSGTCKQQRRCKDVSL